MGQGLSCRGSHEHGLFRVVQHRNIDIVAALLHTHPSLMNHTTVYDHHSHLHIVVVNGQIQVPLSPFSISSHAISQFGFIMALDGYMNLDALNRQKQTPHLQRGITPHGRDNFDSDLVLS